MYFMVFPARTRIHIRKSRGENQAKRIKWEKTGFWDMPKITEIRVLQMMKNILGKRMGSIAKHSEASPLPREGRIHVRERTKS